MAATYTKLKDGSWGIRVTGDKPVKGDRITVTKKSGESKTETIRAILWSGDGVTLCAVEQTSAPRKSYTERSYGSGGSLRGRRTGCSCGSIEGEYHDYYCSSCRFEELDH